MKKTILSAALLLATVAIGSAQQKFTTKRSEKNQQKMDSLRQRNPEQIAKMQSEHLKNTLNLDEKQSNQIYQLALERENNRRAEVEKRRSEIRQKINEQREKTNNIREELKAKREAEMKVYDEKLQKILNKDQFDKYTQIKQERLNKMKEKLAEGRKKRTKNNKTNNDTKN